MDNRIDYCLNILTYYSKYNYRKGKNSILLAITKQLTSTAIVFHNERWL
ncbi:hypothetical protein [Parageobacillus toebii]|uniref:Uncharacterized protein n=1 Tax=Parageobacillus toebii TaxID=153151 RepID=A0A150N5M7_9BACL|nr:hypothetical protein [Parageobacillus toebii]KYD32001.1 hypothetical protein B4110_0473 [Parageobacillus toebii]